MWNTQFVSEVPDKSPKKPRADRGDGSVKQVLTGKHKGKWRARLTYRDKWNRKQEFDRIVGTQREAKQVLKDFKRQLEQGHHTTEREYTLGEWFDWLKDNDWTKELKANTIAYRSMRFERYVRPTLGDMPLSSIRPMAARTFLTEVERRFAAIGEPIGQSTLCSIKSDLVNIINKAIAYEVLDGANPFSVVRVETPELRKGVALTPTQARVAMLRLLVHTQRGEFELWALMMFVLALGTGMRRGELLALAEEQFDFEQGTITVDRAVVVLEKGRQAEDLPKKDKVRTVVLAPTLGKWVKAYLTETKDQRGCSLLFPNAAGKPKMVSQQRKAWHLARKLGKLLPKMVLHDCRLTHNTWIEKLMPEVPTSTRLAHMGHAAGDINSRNYLRELSSATALLRNHLEKLTH